MRNSFGFYSRRQAMAGLVGAALALSACGSGDKNATEAASGGDAPTGPQYPDYYPADYAKLVDAARSEKELLIYSNIAEYNWHDILGGFKRKYPWIKVQALDLGPTESFERYYSEVKSGKRSADLLVVAAPDAWQRFVKNDGPEKYVSPETDKVPEWTRPFPGVYTVAIDPMIIIYNKALMKPAEYPDSLAKLAATAAADPARFRHKLTTYDSTSHSFAYAIHWAAVDHGKMGGWSTLEKLGPFTRPESGGSTMLDKVMSGEYLASFYTSGITVFPRMKDPGRDKILGWALPKDGVPMMMRGMAVTSGSQHKNAAKLLLDYMLSHDGQVNAGKGGMTPYRPDVAETEVPYETYNKIATQVGGEQNMIRIDYDPRLLTDYDAFNKRWAGIFKAQK